MKYRTRTFYTAEQKAEMWDRWQRGKSLHSIARLFDHGHSSIFGQLSPTGGIRPPPRRQSRLALTVPEREEISRGIITNLSLRAIAQQLGRASSTISREINRNGGLKHYRASQADQAACPCLRVFASNFYGVKLRISLCYPFVLDYCFA